MARPILPHQTKTPCIKKKGMLITRSILESDRALFHDSDPHCVGFDYEPEVFEYVFDGRIRRYTPDFRVWRKGLTCPVYEEVKNAKALSSRKTLAQLDVINRSMSRSGRIFRIIGPSEIYKGPRYQNIQFLQRFVASQLSRPALELLAILRASGQTTSINACLGIVKNLCETDVYIAIRHQFLRIDLDQEISGESEVAAACLEVEQ